MKKPTFGLLVCFALLLLATRTSAAEEVNVNMSLKISPGLPHVGDPVILEAVLSGEEGKNYQVGWWVVDPLEIFSSTNLSSFSNPKLVYGLTITNTFGESGVKVATAIVQDAGTTNGIEKFIVFRNMTFLVGESLDTTITLLYPNGNEVWTPGSTNEFKWTSTGTAKQVMIALEQKGSTNKTYLGVVTNSGSYKFTVPFGTNWVTAGTEGNLGGKNYRVVVSVSPLSGDSGNTTLSDTSDDWFTITTGENPNAMPLSLSNLEFSEASVQVYGTKVGAWYRIESSTNLMKPWETNRLFKAVGESSTNSFSISGGSPQSYRLVEADPPNN